MGTRRRVFPESFKREAVERVTSSGPSASQVAQVTPNRFARNFATSTPNQVWLADLTYIPTGEG